MNSQPSVWAISDIPNLSQFLCKICSAISMFAMNYNTHFDLLR